ncbi:MAG TPA: tripartite tricarboxylate transporter TctB family protein [Thermodesulfobacteriota bacterium]
MSRSRLAGINWAAVALAGVGVVAAVESLRLGIGRPVEPGPGLLPLAAAAVLVGSCAAVVARDRVPDEAVREVGRAERLAASLVLLCAALALEPLGYRVTMLSTVTLLARVLGVRRWLVAAAFGAVAAFGSDVLFSDLLGMALPRGSWRL